MDNPSSHELVEKARRILERARKLPAAQQLQGLRDKRIIDEHGQLISIPVNGATTVNGDSREIPS
jgi:hypothetical protein